jgi:hypothetical protein
MSGEIVLYDEKGISNFRLSIKERKMNAFSKILIALVLLTGLSACGAGYSFNTESEQVTSAAAEIADFDLPTGYTADFTASLMGYTVAAFNPGDGHSHLYLIQSADEADGEKLASMLDEVIPGSSDSHTRMTVIETRPVIVSGEETTLVISEGTNGEGEAYRQASVAFQSQGGPALLVFSEPTSQWDQATVDALLASIH